MKVDVFRKELAIDESVSLFNKCLERKESGLRIPESLTHCKSDEVKSVHSREDRSENDKEGLL